MQVCQRGGDDVGSQVDTDTSIDASTLSNQVVDPEDGCLRYACWVTQQHTCWHVTMQKGLGQMWVVRWTFIYVLMYAHILIEKGLLIVDCICL